MTVSTSATHFWDSCVLARHCTQEPKELLGDISKLLDEAKAGKRKIWYSTILYAELRPALLAKGGYASIEELVEEFEGVLFPISPTPPILIRAGRMRDHFFERPQGIRQATEKKRVLTVPDSIQLASCLYVKDTLGVSDIEFHTFDDGRGANYEEKAVSLLRLQEYAGHIQNDPDILAVCQLTRIKPAMAQGNLA